MKLYFLEFFNCIDKRSYSKFFLTNQRTYKIIWSEISKMNNYFLIDFILFVNFYFFGIILYKIRDLEGCVRPDDEDEAGSIQRYFTKTWERIHRVHKSPYKRVTMCGILACFLHFPG